MDKTTLSFQGIIEIDNEKKTTKIMLVIDTTINGHTMKRKHIFDPVYEDPKEIKNNDLCKKKIMDIILKDI